MHKAVTRRVEAKKLLSRRRQSEYYTLILTLTLTLNLTLIVSD